MNNRNFHTAFFANTANNSINIIKSKAIHLYTYMLLKRSYTKISIDLLDIITTYIMRKENNQLKNPE